MPSSVPASCSWEAEATVAAISANQISASEIAGRPRSPPSRLHDSCLISRSALDACGVDRFPLVAPLRLQPLRDSRNGQLERCRLNSPIEPSLTHFPTSVRFQKRSPVCRRNAAASCFFLARSRRGEPAALGTPETRHFQRIFEFSPDGSRVPLL